MKINNALAITLFLSACVSAQMSYGIPPLTTTKELKERLRETQDPRNLPNYYDGVVMGIALATRSWSMAEKLRADYVTRINLCMALERAIKAANQAKQPGLAEELRTRFHVIIQSGVSPATCSDPAEDKPHPQ